MPDLKSPNIVDLFEVVEDLGFHYDELSYSGQEVYEKLAKLVGTDNYKIYSTVDLTMFLIGRPRLILVLLLFNLQ